MKSFTPNCVEISSMHGHKKNKRQHFCKHNTGNFTILSKVTTIPYSVNGQKKTIILQ